MTENYIAGLERGREIARDVMSGETSPDCAARMIGGAIKTASRVPDADFSRGTADGYAEVCKAALACHDAADEAESDPGEEPDSYDESDNPSNGWRCPEVQK